jgi:predicted transglutaminase-like cysteine proteinase
MTAVAYHIIWSCGRQHLLGAAAFRAGGGVIAFLVTMLTAAQATSGQVNPTMLAPLPSKAPHSSTKATLPTFFILNATKREIEGRTAPVESFALSHGTAAVDAAATTGDEPFGLAAFRAPEGMVWTKWRALRDRMAWETNAIERCRAAHDACVPAARAFLDIVNGIMKRPIWRRLEAANAAVNAAVRYTSDLTRHGTADHWSSALETLADGQGDCEDYAITKYAVLRATGIPEGDLRILLVRDRAGGPDHALLAARAGERWSFLDNRWDTVEEEMEAVWFVPLFALGGNEVRLLAAPHVRTAVPDDESDAVTPAAAAQVRSRIQRLPQASQGTRARRRAVD